MEEQAQNTTTNNNVTYHHLRHSQEQQQHDDMDTMIYGNELSRVKNEDRLLCAFANINGLPQKRHNPRERILRKLITDYDINIMGMAEINLNWT